MLVVVLGLLCPGIVDSALCAEERPSYGYDISISHLLSLLLFYFETSIMIFLIRFL